MTFSPVSSSSSSASVTPPPPLGAPRYPFEQLNKESIKLGLHRLHFILEQWNHPQNELPCVHVAGTNGKGSVCTLLSHGLVAQGFKVGLTISPHVFSVHERIQLNNTPITHEAMATHSTKLWSKLTQLLGPYHAGHEEWPTYFEFLILLAFRVFREEGVDIVILETGLGGELDATNVIASPLCSVITSIGWDHMDRLGDTLTAIATAKAGIIKPHCPVVLGSNIPTEAKDTLLRVANERHAGPVLQADAAVLQSYTPFTPQGTQRIHNRISHETLELGLLGQHQLHNLATLLATMNTLQRHGFMRNKKAFYQGLARARWVGRLQYVPQQRCFIDGSHNSEGFEALKHSLKEVVGHAPLVWLLSLRNNRPMEALLPLLRAYASQSIGVVITEPAWQTAGLYHSPQVLRQFLREQLPELETRFIWAGQAPPEAVRLWQSVIHTHPTALGLATGSLYPLPEYLSLLGLAPDKVAL